MEKSRRMSGYGRLNTILGVILGAVLILGSIKVVTTKIRNTRFKAEMRNIALHQNRSTEAQMRTQLLEVAAGLDIPIQDRQILIRKSRTNVFIEAKYEDTVDFYKIYSYKWKFNPTVDQPIIP